jgi:hypothetical protein
MARVLKIGNAVLCEYVAQGEGGKSVLVNVYSGDVVLAELPAHVLLALYVECLPETLDQIDLRIEMFKDEAKFAEAKMTIKIDELGSPVVVVLRQFPVQFETPAVFSVRLSAPGYKSLTVLRKKFRLAIPQAA